MFQGNDVKERCDFENLLHAKWSNFDNTPKKSTKFSRMLGEDEKMICEKFCFQIFKQRSSKLKKGYSQDLVKQTVGGAELHFPFSLREWHIFSHQFSPKQ